MTKFVVQFQKCNFCAIALTIILTGAFTIAGLSRSLNNGGYDVSGVAICNGTTAEVLTSFSWPTWPSPISSARTIAPIMLGQYAGKNSVVYQEDDTNAPHVTRLLKVDGFKITWSTDTEIYGKCHFTLDSLEHLHHSDKVEELCPFVASIGANKKGQACKCPKCFKPNFAYRDDVTDASFAYDKAINDYGMTYAMYYDNNINVIQPKCVRDITSCDKTTYENEVAYLRGKLRKNELFKRLIDAPGRLDCQQWYVYNQGNGEYSLKRTPDSYHMCQWKDGFQCQKEEC